MQPKPAAWLVDDALFDAHVLGGPEHPAYHPERPERLLAARAAVTAADVDWRRCAPRSASLDELARVHSPRYLESLDKLRGTSGYLDADTYVAPRSVEAAWAAAGGAIALVDNLIASDVKQGVALLRPPGHHARVDEAMGFCLVNNVAVAAAHALSRGLRRVLVLDWDVHHGNGTQEIFWRSPEVLYASLHQFPFYPGTGAANEVGEGDGHGFTVNVPLSAGGADDVYRSAFERAVLPVAAEFAPELVLVSAGFDASQRDPLAQMRLSAAAFGWMAKALRGVADASAGGRIGLILEGGYDLVGLETGLSAAVAGAVRAEADDIAPPRAVPPEVVRAAKVAARSWRLG
jgi:acetoin utilization deacetylase AcuC-like enzyme